LAYERGLLSGPDLNIVQEKLLTVHLVRRQEREQEREENNFEQQLLIHRPEAYKKYTERKELTKEDNFGYDEIVWRAPESVDELSEVTRAVSEAHQQLQGLQDEEFERELEALRQLRDIDLSLIKDDDEP
jgi:hypothetical protein